MRLTCITALAVAAISVSQAGGLEITRAYYRDTNSSLHLFLTNRGTEPVSVLPPVVNGFDCAALGRDENRPRDILWYRCRPSTIAPGEIADLMIVLPQRTDKPAVVELSTSSGQKLRKTIRCVTEQMRFQAIVFSRDLRTVDLYIRWADPSKMSSLRKVRLDGRDVGRLSKPWPARSADGLAYTRISLPEPLGENTFHVLEVEAEGGLSTAYQIRAIPAEFTIGIYGACHPQNIEDWAAHGCDHHISFHPIPLDLMDALAASGMTGGPKYIKEHLIVRDEAKVAVFDEDAARSTFAEVTLKPNILYHHLADEPDVADHYAGRWLGSTAMELAARAEFCEKHDPGRYTFVQIDNTFRPDNYRVYGESADVLATHRYSLGNYLKTEAGIEGFTRPAFLEDMLETTSRFRAATEPRPHFMLTHFFNLGPQRSGRPPTIEEMRLQCYIMLGEGARGIIHYIHSGSSGKGEGGRTPELWDAMTGLHEEIRRVGDVTVSGTPVPQSWATASTPNVIARALLCGDEMAVVLINRSHRSSLDRFTAVPMCNVVVSLRVPPWIDASALRARLADTGSPLAVTLKGDTLSFTVDEVLDGRCVLLRRK